MSLFDTRFFFEHYYSGDQTILRKTRALLATTTRAKYVSVVTVHEVYRLALDKEGRDVAELRTTLLEKDFAILPMDNELAKVSAEMRSRYRIPMADSIIAATAKFHRLRCITDDPHLTQMKEIKTGWI